MTRVKLLDELVNFTEAVTATMRFPVRVQKAGESVTTKAPSVYRMRLPDSTSATKKAPYILHQVITGVDEQREGQREESTCTIRSIFCVYCDDEQEGAMYLLNLMERMRIALLRQRVLGRYFQLDLEEQIQTLNYPEDTAPYYAGEMVTVWQMPTISQELNSYPEYEETIVIGGNTDE